MTGMWCADVVELVTDFVEGALDSLAERRVADHLPGCPGCERYVEQIRQTLRLLHGRPADQTLPLPTRAALLAALR